MEARPSVGCCHLAVSCALPCGGLVPIQIQCVEALLVLPRESFRSPLLTVRGCVGLVARCDP